MEKQYIRINKLLKDNFPQYLKFVGKVQPINTYIDEFYAILDELKDVKFRMNVITGHRDLTGNKKLFDIITDCNNFEQVFLALGGYTNENLDYIEKNLI